MHRRVGHRCREENVKGKLQNIKIQKIYWVYKRKHLNVAAKYGEVSCVNPRWKNRLSENRL
jgi:hypothetical protein